MADERYWKLECDKAQNGYAVIRFLPAPDGEDMPFVKLYSHAFQGKGGWYIENSLDYTQARRTQSPSTTPSYGTMVLTAGKEQARKQKRKLTYVANIMVIKDPANPQNEGGVFLYKFGKKIFDKVMSAMQPEFEDEEAINPFDFWEGASFKLKAKNVAGYRNYDSSEFGKVEPLLGGDDDALEALWNKENSLSELVAADQFKDYEVLKKRFQPSPRFAVLLAAVQPPRKTLVMRTLKHSYALLALPLRRKKRHTVSPSYQQHQFQSLPLVMMMML